MQVHTPHPTKCRAMRPSVPRFTIKALPLATALCCGVPVQAQGINPGVAGLPQGGTVAAGAVSGQLAGDLLTLTQSSTRAVLDWSSFNIGAGKEVRFVQPGATAAVLNRVPGSAGMSEIYGALNANGMVLLMNPNGVLFGQGATVNVGALIATTGTVNQTAFDAGGAFAITGVTAGSIVNRGTISVAGAGLAALVAPSVVNSGTIVATGGKIVLSGADRATVSLNGGLYEFAVDAGAQGTQASITNAAGGTLNGGTLLLSTGDAADLVSGVVNLQGVQQATSAIIVNGNTVVLGTDLNAPGISGNSNSVQVQPGAFIQDAVDVARTGGSVHVAAGTHVQPATLRVNKSLALAGDGAGATFIDARGITGNYGINVSASDVTLSDFTVYGPSAYVASAYGIKVSPGSTATFPLRNFTIRNVASRGAGKAELDLNGVDGALIDQVTLNGAPAGNDTGATEGAGLQITDSANVTVRNTTTLNNNWGGVALYQANRSYNQQVNNITIEGNNHFTEANPVYLQDESVSQDFGRLDIAGFAYAVRNSSNAGSSQYTWLQATQQGGYDLAVNLPGLNPAYSASASYIQGWNGNGGGTTQVFEVGTGNLLAGGTQAMRISTAVNQAASGATIQLGAGSYAEQLVLNKAGLTLNGSSGAKLVVPDLAAVNGIEIRADNVTVRGLEIAGPLNGVPYDVYYRVEPGYATPTHISRGIAVMAGFTGFTLRDNNIHDVRNGILIHGSNGTGNVVADNRIDNTKSGISVQYTGGAGIDIAGNREGALGNEWGLNLNLNRYANDSQKQEAPDLAWQQQLLGLSAANGGWSVQDQGFRSANRTVVYVATGAEGGRAGVQGSRLTPMDSVQSGVNAVVSGGTVNVRSGSYAESVTVNGLRQLHFNDAWLQGLTLNSGAAGTGIGGEVTATTSAGIVFQAPATLLADTALRTQGADIVLGGDLQNAGSTPYALTLVAGSGSSRGNVSMTTGGTASNPLGALAVTANDFFLADTLWVRSYGIDAHGNVALSHHTLNATAPGITNTLAATGNVTGSTTSQGSVEVVSAALVDLNVAAQGRASVAAETVRGTLSGTEVVATAQDAMQVTVTAGSTATLAASTLTATVVAPTVAVDAGGAVQLNLQSTTATVRADGPVVVQGSAGTVNVDAPSGSLQGSFGDVNNAGTGVFSVNGRPELNQTLSANAENNRVIPGSSALAGSLGGEGTPAPRTTQVAAVALNGRAAGAPLVRGSPQAAGTAILELGQSVELDLTPGREREAGQ